MQVIDGNPVEIVPVAKALNNALQFFLGTLREMGFDISRKAFGEHLRLRFQLSGETTLLRPHFVIRKCQRYKRNPNDERYD